MNIQRINYFFSKRTRFIMICILGILINVAVYLTGGTSNSVIIVSFIPIFLMASQFGFISAITIAIVLGLISGPFMPAVVRPHIMQTTLNWSFRLGIFVIFAGISAHVFYKIRILNNMVKKNYETDLQTGLKNQHVLFPVVDDMLEKNEEFYFIIIKIYNLQNIDKYIHPDLVSKHSKIIVSKIRNIFSENELYLIHPGEFL